MQDRAQRRNILIGLLLMASGVGGALLMAPRTEAPVAVEKRPGPDKPPLPMPTPPPLQKADLEASIATLDQWLSATAAQTAATSNSDVALLLHAVRGLGPDHDLKGKSTKQALLERLPTVLLLQDGKPLVSPLQSASEPGRPGEPLPELAVLATLLEADVPLEQTLLPNLTLGNWLEHARKAPAVPANDADWYSRNWWLDALSIGVAREVDPPSSAAAREQLHNAATAGFDRLSRGHRIFGTWAGQGARAAVQSRDTVELTRQQQLGPYSLEGWGLPLAHSVLRAVVTLNQVQDVPDKTLNEASRQLLGQLVVRQLFERQLWASSENPLPTAKPVDQLGYCGRLLEALAWARLAIDSAIDEGPAQIGPALRDCASSVAAAMKPLGLTAPPAGPPTGDAQAAQVRRTAEGVSQALRGLRMVRRAYWPAPAANSAPPH